MYPKDGEAGRPDERWIDTTWIFYARWHGPLDGGMSEPAYATVVTKDGDTHYFGKEAAEWLRTRLHGAQR